MRLPYVTEERLPSGAIRYRYRRGGVKVTLKGKPGSREFLDHYNTLREGVQIPESKAIRGSVEWLVGLYLDDLERRVGNRLASPLTLKAHRHHLGKLIAEHGDKDANMPRSHLIKLHDKMGATPGAADNMLKAVSALYKWAIRRDHVTCENPARDVQRIRRKTDGFAPWTADDFAKYLARHAPGTMARRALILAMATTARRGDLCLLGRQNEVQMGGRTWLRWKQAKAPHGLVEMPMSAALMAELHGSGNMTYLLNGYGAPFSVAGLGNRFRKWCDEAGLKRRSLHGIRKGLSAMLAGQGATSTEIDVLLGHEMGSPETRVYVRSAERQRLAEAVIGRVDALVTVPHAAWVTAP
ncbi:MAG: tyrosine recombinase XerC [Alphaproteobacteria bacterium]